MFINQKLITFSEIKSIEILCYIEKLLATRGASLFTFYTFFVLNVIKNFV